MTINLNISETSSNQACIKTKGVLHVTLGASLTFQEIELQGVELAAIFKVWRANIGSVLYAWVKFQDKPFFGPCFLILILFYCLLLPSEFCTFIISLLFGFTIEIKDRKELTIGKSSFTVLEISFGVAWTISY